MTGTDSATYQDYVERIHYSERYSDDEYEYRHVILPKGMLKLIPKSYFEPGGTVLRLLTEDEWRGMGIQQSLGWETYSVHAPEPHILLFRREKDYQTKYGPMGKQKA
ncbi:Cyclin-dependent kinases regulatory subunit (Cell division control protein cks1) [Microbotryomycetes sp. JL201]|nr:Cyclin-dependent kinases regulatory subunit (Cell division control protein cks1) [Microbotryomycetes sp. JL201]